jgi:hypothetical protein
MEKLILSILLLLLSYHHSFAQQKMLVAIDGSGSMKGYFHTKEINHIIDQLQTTARANQIQIETNLFVSSPINDSLESSSTILSYPIWETWNFDHIDKNTWGTETHLNDALNELYNKSDILIMITDNFQDDGAVGSNDNESFYQSIREKNFKYVYFAPFKVMFDGNVDLFPTNDLSTFQEAKQAKALLDYLKSKTLSNASQSAKLSSPSLVKKPGRPSYWKLHYNGLRSLAMYIFVSQSASQTKLFEFIKALGSKYHFLSENLLLIHPIAQDSFSLTNLDSFDPKLIAGICQLPVAENATDIKPQVKISSTTDENIPYKLSVNDKALVNDYNPKRSSALTLGLEVSFSNKQIQMSNQENPCDTQLDLKIVDFVNQTKIDGMLRSDIPSEISTQLFPSKLVIIDKEKSRAQALINIELPAIVNEEIDNEVVTGNIESSFNIAVKVPKNMIQLSDKFKNDIFTENPSDLTKIYSSQDLISYLIPNKESYFFVKLPVRIEPDVLSYREAPIVEEEPIQIPWGLILSVLLSILGFNHYYQPFGLKVPIKYQEHQKGRLVKLGGLFYHTDPKKINIDDSFIQLKRNSNFSKKIDILDNKNNVIGQLEKPSSYLYLEENDEKKLEWLNKTRSSTLKNKRLLDEEL